MNKEVYFKRNLETYVKILFSFGFSALILKLIFEGDMNYFINPKLIPFVILCTFMLLATSVVTFFKRHETHEKSSFKLSYLVYMVPLIIGFTVPARTISTSGFEIQDESLKKLQSLQNSGKSDITDNEALNNNYESILLV